MKMSTCHILTQTIYINGKQKWARHRVCMVYWSLKSVYSVYLSIQQLKGLPNKSNAFLTCRIRWNVTLGCKDKCLTQPPISHTFHYKNITQLHGLGVTVDINCSFRKAGFSTWTDKSPYNFTYSHTHTLSVSVLLKDTSAGGARDKTANLIDRPRTPPEPQPPLIHTFMNTVAFK